MTTQDRRAAVEAAKKLPEYWDCAEAVRVGTADAIQQFIHDNEPAGREDERTFREGLGLALQKAREEERERCAKVADDRQMADQKRYEAEADWRLPYAFNRVIRASMDIAAAIRALPESET